MRKLLPVLVLILLAVLVYSKLDWWSTPEHHSTWAMLLRYWGWQSVFWMLFGLTVALAYWAGAKSGCNTRVIAILIFVTFGLLNISGLADLAYFWFNTYALPPIEQKWTWMPQTWILGFDWGTPQQVQWTIAWLLAVPIVWIVTVKYLIPKYCRT